MSILKNCRYILTFNHLYLIYLKFFPQMWPEIIRKAKEGGINVIQTYVFWNIHEPVQGQVIKRDKSRICYHA